MFNKKHPLYIPYRIAKRIVICIVGGTVLLIGVAMIVLPGPAFVVIPAGLAILGIEFAWARIWLRKVKTKAQKVARSVAARYGRGSQPPTPPAPPTS